MTMPRWSIIKQVQSFFERRKPQPLAELGTLERVNQTKTLSRHFQEMCVIASIAYKKRLRGE